MAELVAADNPFARPAKNNTKNMTKTSIIIIKPYLVLLRFNSFHARNIYNLSKLF
ncbi:hypothetical protein SDC9_182615 [bioreactor metagenome]|uniref:Uncharacterized protein n=1 Tax=bioreactor metagenome TaxID=1076179 RepID=A0A645H8V3_9ZZZZ